MTTQPLVKLETITQLEGVRWETYQALLFDLAESGNKKLTFNNGVLEIMTPLPEHEINKEFLGRLIWATTEFLGLEVASLGSTTLSREDLGKGIEPDQCFYIQNEPLIRGKTMFDFRSDPVPDLAIEVDVTSSSLNRLQIYQALGVKEVWRYNKNDLFIYCLQDRTYQLQEYSQVLPILSKVVVLEFLSKRAEMGENALLGQFRQCLQKLSS